MASMRMGNIGGNSMRMGQPQTPPNQWSMLNNDYGGNSMRMGSYGGNSMRMGSGGGNNMRTDRAGGDKMSMGGYGGGQQGGGSTMRGSVYDMPEEDQDNGFAQLLQQMLGGRR
jgi:hypothetical protein